MVRGDLQDLPDLAGLEDLADLAGLLHPEDLSSCRDLCRLWVLEALAYHRFLGDQFYPSDLADREDLPAILHRRDLVEHGSWWYHQWLQ